MSRFSVKKPYTVIVGVLIVIIMGYMAFTNLTTDLLPSMNLPYAIVMTTYAGASPEEVESVVTQPIESSMATVSNIEHISSVSNENYSMVILQFAETANMDAITVEMRESLDMIGSYWPDSVGNPIIMKLNPDMLPVMIMAVSGEGMSDFEITDIVNDQIIADLESIEGVASVSATGLIEESIQVILLDEKVAELNKKLQDKIAEKFDEAQEELDEKKEELEDGKSELESAKNSAASQMADAESQISAGQAEITKNEAVLASQLASLEQQEALLKAAEDQLNALLNESAELDKAEAELAAAESMFQQGVTELTSALFEIENQIQMLEAKKETEEGLNEIEEAGLAQLKETKSSLEKQLEDLQAEGIKLQASKEALNLAREGLNVALAGKDALIEQINSGKAAIAEGKQMINQYNSQIAAGKMTLSQAAAELSKSKALATIEMSVLQTQMTLGEAQMESAADEIENMRESAMDSASLENVLTTDMLKGILVAQNFSMPAGYITEDGVDYLVRVGDKLQDIDDIGDLLLMDLSDQDLGEVYLKDIADVIVLNNSSDTYAVLNGEPGIILSVEKQTDYSTAEVAKLIRSYMESDKVIENGLMMTALMDQGVYIDMVIDSVLSNLIMGGILAIIILFIFLKDIKPTLVVGLSIPVSVVFAIALMYFSGVTLNIISLSGLALGVGMLVDNSIVVIENIYRLRNNGVSARTAAIQGAKQVTGAIIASTLTTICIWAPIIFVEGITKQLFVDLVLTIGYSLLASLIVALTVVPMMSSLVLKKTKKQKNTIFKGIAKAYSKALIWSLKYKIVIIAGTIILLIVSSVAVLSRGMEFMGSMDSTQISVSVTMEEGSTLDETAEISDLIVERIMTIDDVDSVGAMIGSGMSIMSMGSSSSTDSVSMYVILKDNKKLSSEAVAGMIEEMTADLDCEVSASGSTMDLSVLGGSGVSVMIKGRDIDTLKEIANDMAEVLASIEGTIDVSNGQEDPVPEIRITVDKTKAMANSLTVAQIFQELYGRVGSESSTTTLSTTSKDYEITVLDAEDEALTREGIEEIIFTATNSDGDEIEIPLTDIATITEEDGLSSIRRDAQQRYITVSAGIADGHNATLIGSEFQRKVSNINLPDGYKLEFSGEDETINEAMGELVKLLVLGIAIMYLIMVAQFQSLLYPFIVLFTIPLAFTGGFIGLLITGNLLSVIAMVGFVMLCGIIVNNGIVFIDYANQLIEEGYDKKDAIIETGKTRLRPILMTAMTTILAMSTMALGIGTGSDMVQPMAIVSIGGLIYGTFMTLFFVPVIYDIFNRKGKKEKDVKTEELDTEIIE